MKNILDVVYRQGYILRKFKQSDKFTEMVKELGVNKSTVCFNINLIKVLDNFTDFM